MQQVTDRATYHDRFNKAEAAAREANAEVKKAYGIWFDACERLKRIERERYDAWCDLVAPVGEKRDGRPCDAPCDAVTGRDA